MKLFLQNRLVYYMMLALLVFWVVAPFFPRRFLLEWLNGLGLAVGIGLLITFTPGIWKDLRANPGRPTPGQMIGLGIVSLAVFVLLSLGWAWAFQFLDQPESMRDNIFRAWISYGAVCSLTVMLVGVLVDPRKDFLDRPWKAVGLIVSASVVITILTLSFIGRS